MQSIIVDTSAIIFAAENRVDIFKAIEEQMPGAEIILSNGIMEEIEMLTAAGGERKKHAKVALGLVEKHKIKMLKDHSYVDGWIVKESAERKCVVCTNDIALKEELKKAKIKVLSVSGSGILR